MADPSIERFRRVVSAASAYLDERRQEVNDRLRPNTRGAVEERLARDPSLSDRTIVDAVRLVMCSPEFQLT